MGKATIISPPDSPIPSHLVEWMVQQHVFFVATAPKSINYHVNVSPKSSSQFRILPGHFSVAYLDLSGSGTETIAHIMENGRLTIMFVELENSSPRIVRLFGQGIVMPRDQISQPELLQMFNKQDLDDPGFRAIIQLNVERCSTSCGYSIPKFKYIEERQILRDITEKLGQDGLVEYRAKKNYCSIDGLPGIAQFYLTSETPARIEIEDGFPMAYYDTGNNNNLKNGQQNQDKSTNNISTNKRYYSFWQLILYYIRYIKYRIVHLSNMTTFWGGIGIGIVMSRYFR
jgi:hypothetical protein